jgi:hypothetical protein
MIPADLIAWKIKRDGERHLISFPLAHLFELGGTTVWAPAILHFVIQGTVKIVILSNVWGSSFPFIGMVASALLPLLVLCVLVRKLGRFSRAGNLGAFVCQAYMKF